MKFKAYLLNEQRSKPISEEDAFGFLEKNCSKALQSYEKRFIIYRGVNQPSNFLRVNPKKVEKARVSSEGRNFYTLLFDNLPSWKAFPKRSLSLICSNNESYAKSFGNVFLIFPFDGAKIGVCPKSDIWFSFKNVGIGNMDRFNQEINNLLEFASRIMKEQKKKFDMNWQVFSKYLDILDKAAQIYQLDFKEFRKIGIDRESKWVDEYLDGVVKGKKIRNLLNDLLDPRRSGFDLIKIGDSGVKGPKKVREVWTDSESILVSVDSIDSLKIEGLISM